MVFPKSPRYFNRSEKEYIIQEYLLGECTKREIWEKYTGRKEEHGSLLRWMLSLGLAPASKLERTNFIPSDTLELKKNDQMQKDKLTHKQGSTREEPKVAELRNRIA
ncbi:hypothetical protein Aasi_0342 [Candidatus Amoebophilus asiaticus 5a2]|uniref:Uncharacterized protein n=1 Tax=Amoebophilus asiaticus (strain 5a2) TaxID=452471 RepID=B3ERB9_AMOA5|nr:hypothetical protein [Candidatus Amoebophilus asiaticus]ACE05771.1 hypothetical protein Aasi_0342 [Candidatus Amoebophilus asiaticus 5a2]